MTKVKISLDEDVVAVNENDETDYDLVYMTDPRTGIKSLRGGTLDKFIIKLTAATVDEHDIDFDATFLLTYRSFTKPLVLFNLLRKRFDCGPDKPPDQVDPQIQPIRLRVFNFLKIWLSQYTYEFIENEELMCKLKEFIDQDMSQASMLGPAKVLQNILTKKAAQMTPNPVPTERLKLRIQTAETSEIAQQLTVFEHQLYCKIKPWECFKAGWTKAKKEILSPNISAFIAHFNRVSMWVATEVVRHQTVKQRAQVIQQFISIGKHLKGLQNYNGCMEIIAGLEQSSISRLKISWAEVSSSSQKAFAELSNLVKATENYKNLREAFAQNEPPLIPYIGVYLSDLVFLEEGNPDFLWAQEGFINFYKCNKIATVIKSLQHFQTPPYPYTLTDKYHCYWSRLQPLTEDQLYKYSYQLCPLGKAAETDRDPELQNDLNELLNKRCPEDEEEVPGSTSSSPSLSSSPSSPSSPSSVSSSNSVSGNNSAYQVTKTPSNSSISTSPASSPTPATATQSASSVGGATNSPTIPRGEGVSKIKKAVGRLGRNFSIDSTNFPILRRRSATGTTVPSTFARSTSEHNLKEMIVKPKSLNSSVADLENTAVSPRGKGTTLSLTLPKSQFNPSSTTGSGQLINDPDNLNHMNANTLIRLQETMYHSTVDESDEFDHIPISMPVTSGELGK